MTLANIGWDLQAFSKGRFILGLGSQIKPHITKRFSMPWSHPAPRMREMILAIRAIWDCWHNGTKLDFRGDFYTHTLMTPFFNPGPEPDGIGVPKIFLAGVGELMTEVAGEVCDGFLCHGFTTERYLREVTIPALERGPGQGGQDDGGLRDRRARASSSPAPTRRSWPTAAAGHHASRSPSTARRRPTAACSSSTAGAACRTSSTRCPSRASGWRWATSSTTRSSTPSPSSASPSGIAPELSTAATATSSSASASTRPYRTDPERWQGVMAALRAA